MNTPLEIPFQGRREPSSRWYKNAVACVDFKVARNRNILDMENEMKLFIVITETTQVNL